MPNWIRDALFYEIYPQSFMDSNDDGIGDIPGIIDKLDYIKETGCNAIWLNPCYESPFHDGGYDITDYKKIAPRYGTMEDMLRLLDEVHARDMHLLMDLVPGHTSEEHPWFLQSSQDSKNPFAHRYIWTKDWFHAPTGYPYIGGECPRDGIYLINFFKCQPALNYGFKTITQDWQMPMDHKECQSTKEALKDIMRFWLDKGCDGFRVDMADSLVKNDDKEKSGTGSIWSEIRQMMDESYPEAVLLSEWNEPRQSLKYGFHMDFYLDWVGNGYNKLMRNYSTDEDQSYFKFTSSETISGFLEDYLPKYEASKSNGYYCFITGNHDTLRASYNLSPDELKLTYSFLITMPGIPFLYYGDEIGMHYLDLPTKEGGYTRTGSRTPMQWNSEKNYGFSNASEDLLYLPQDLSSNAPTVEKQQQDSASLYHVVKDLLHFRSNCEDLKDNSNFSVLYTGVNDKGFAYKRGHMIMVINPSNKPITIPNLPVGNICYHIGNGIYKGSDFIIQPQSFLIIEKGEA